MNNKTKDDNEEFQFENDVKVNYTDFLKDTEEIEAQLKKEEEEKKKKLKEKIKKFEPIKFKSKTIDENIYDENNDSLDFDSAEIKKAESFKIKTTVALVGVLVVVFIYFIISFAYYNNRFLPSTVINEVNCSNKTVDEISDIMEDKINDYHLTIVYNDITVDELYGRDINISFGDMDKVLQEICDNQKKLSWLKGVFCESEHIRTGKGLQYNTSILNQFINSSLVLGITSTTKSVDAGIEFKDGKYEIVPAVYGDEINTSAVINKIIGAVNSLDESIDINNDDCFIMPNLTEDNKNLIESCKKANELIKTKIEFNVTDDLFEIPVDIKKDWLSVNSEGSLVFAEDVFSKYMDKVDKSYSANTEVRDFKTFHGDTVKVTGGDFGTALNRDKLRDDMENAMFGGDNTKVVAEFYVSQKEIGDSYIEVDLSNQMLWMFVNGEQKLCTPVITGRDDNEHKTPEGVYRLKSKSEGGTVVEKNESKSVKYWMSISGDVGICDALWKNLFGGEIYKTEGSDGSIYVLEDAAKTIYENSFENMPIVCYNHAIVEDYFIEDSYMNELMDLIANKPEIPVYDSEKYTEETTVEEKSNDSENQEETTEPPDVLTDKNNIETETSENTEIQSQIESQSTNSTNEIIEQQ